VHIRITENWPHNPSDRVAAESRVPDILNDQEFLTKEKEGRFLSSCSGKKIGKGWLRILKPSLVNGIADNFGATSEFQLVTKSRFVRLDCFDADSKM